LANLDLLLRSLSYIDEHLDCDIPTEEIAKACFASKSSLEKVFRYATMFSVHDYILRRRMMKASQMMIEKPNMSLLDIAVQYGYSSHEAFTRGFYSVWHCNPSEFREKYAGKPYVPEIFPQITGIYQNQGEPFMRRNLDVSRLQDHLQERNGCYFVCFDIVKMMKINDVSMKAGDIALITAMNRMVQCAGEDDICFRIDCDEFVILTASNDEAYAKSIMDNVLAMNGQLIDYEECEVPLNLYGNLVICDSQNLNYQEMCTNIKLAINDARMDAKKKGIR